MPTTVAVVPHTHWDREWYAPFQSFRLRLVELLDELLPMLERDPSYARFLLDGQTVVLDDYLAVRPDARDALRRLGASGRLSIGPWHVLMDEFMVSGETIVRNLQTGLERAAAFGGAMPIGYLPDMFGHVAQMPQLLRLAGFEHAVVWRGVPGAIDRSAFRWEAPDGSAVRAEYLFGSYSNGRDLPEDPDELVGRARDYDLELGDARLAGGDLLLMNGTDHQRPQPWLGAVVAAANAAQDAYRFEVTSLPEYLAGQPAGDLPAWRGELRSGARANLLMGVASNRIDVHRACAAAERAVTARAEPLAALFVPPAAYPASLLAEAWGLLLLNSAHDSACACSHDEVVEQVLVRYRESRQIGDGLTRASMRALAASIDAAPGSTVVANPTARARGGAVEVTVPETGPVHLVAEDGTPCATQIVGDTSGIAFATTVTARHLAWVVQMMRGTEFAGVRVARHTRQRSANGTIDLVFEGATPDDAGMELDAVREELRAAVHGDDVFRFEVRRPPGRRVVVAAPEVPGFGWRTLRPAVGPGPDTALGAGPGPCLANEHLRVEVDERDGTFSITADGVRTGGLGRLVDGGDGGDTYNYSPPATDRLVSAPDAVTVEVVEGGPVRARLRIDRAYRWPRRAVGDERACSARSREVADVSVSTLLELRAGERFVRVRVELDHHVRDHRLRAHFPLPSRVEGSDAECAFAVVHRGLAAEGGPQEAGLPTFVSRRFVDASDGECGLALLHDGLLEYEVVEDAGRQELALTLLRATGYLSRAEPALRPNPAGPLEPLEGPQLGGRCRCDFAVLVHRGDWRDANCYARADELLVPLERRRGGVPGAARAPAGGALEVVGAEVSSLTRGPGGLVLRVFNPGPATALCKVRRDGRPLAGWCIDLRGRPLARFDGERELRGGEILTLAVG